jgi:hypothetical protein
MRNCRPQKMASSVLADPGIHGLTVVFTFVYSIREEI